MVVATHCSLPLSLACPVRLSCFPRLVSDAAVPLAILLPGSASVCGAQLLAGDRRRFFSFALVDGSMSKFRLLPAIVVSDDLWVLALVLCGSDGYLYDLLVLSHLFGASSFCYVGVCCENGPRSFVVFQDRLRFAQHLLLKMVPFVGQAFPYFEIRASHGF